MEEAHQTSLHALVFGASGIVGWGMVNELLNGYPTADTFSTVTALTNRPITRESSLWPDSDKLQLLSGIDLLSSQVELESQLMREVPSIDIVTHVYFAAYILDVDAVKECEINRTLLERAVTAIENLSPRLRFVLLPTGTKHYGINVPGKFPFGPLPLRESQPRIPEEYAKTNFYFHQVDLLRSMSANKKWTFCNVIPDLVIGFVPNDNFYNTAQVLGRYFSLVRAVEGEGAKVIFPGNSKSWKQLNNDSSQDVLARFAIWTSLHASVTSGESYNVADNPKPLSWGDKWDMLCSYFGVRGEGPPPDESEERGPDPGQYLKDHNATWQRLEEKHGLRPSPMGHSRDYSFTIGPLINILSDDRPMSIEKCHQAWGSEAEIRDAKSIWYTAFDRMRAARILP